MSANFNSKRYFLAIGTGVASFYLAIFEIFDSFLKNGLSMRGTDLIPMSTSPLMKHFFTPGG